MLHSILLFNSLHKSLWELSGLSTRAAETDGSQQQGCTQNPARRGSVVSCPDRFSAADVPAGEDIETADDGTKIGVDYHLSSDLTLRLNDKDGAYYSQPVSLLPSPLEDPVSDSNGLPAKRSAARTCFSQPVSVLPSPCEDWSPQKPFLIEHEPNDEIGNEASLNSQATDSVSDEGFVNDSPRIDDTDSDNVELVLVSKPLRTSSARQQVPNGAARSDFSPPLKPPRALMADGAKKPAETIDGIEDLQVDDDESQEVRLDAGDDNSSNTSPYNYNNNSDNCHDYNDTALIDGKQPNNGIVNVLNEVDTSRPGSTTETCGIEGREDDVTDCKESEIQPEEPKWYLPSVKALRSQFEVKNTQKLEGYGSVDSLAAVPRISRTKLNGIAKDQARVSVDQYKSDVKKSQSDANYSDESGKQSPRNGHDQRIISRSDDTSVDDETETRSLSNQYEDSGPGRQLRRSRSIIGQSDKSIPELIQSLDDETISQKSLPASFGLSPKKRVQISDSISSKKNGTMPRAVKPIWAPEPPTLPEDVIPSIIAQFGSDSELPNDFGGRTGRLSSTQWDMTTLLQQLYQVQSPEPTYSPSSSATFVNLEGYLEKLPSGRKKATFWNAWKRRFFRARDGYLYYYQNHLSDKPSLMLNLMGGHVDSMDTTMLGIDDGKGHYVVVRCSSKQEAEKWRTALQTHTAENFNLTYTQPVPAHPHFYEDVIVIDLGSCSVRAGVLCNQPTLPQIFFPSVCCTNHKTGNRIYGIEALKPEQRINGSLSFPLRPSAKITKYSVEIEAVAGLLRKVFNELNMDPKKYQVQLSLPRSMTVRTQVEVVRLLLDKLEVRSVNLTAQTVLSLLSYNATSGIVVDIGERMDIIPIIDGYIVEPGVSRIPYGGARIIDHLRHFLLQRNFSLVADVESYLVRYILEQMCYCAENYNEELQRYYSDPDGFERSVPVREFFQDEAPWEEIALDNGRFQAPEGLFNPDAWGLDNPGVHKLVHKAIQECSLDIRKEMTRSIYLSGGLTLMPGFAARLELEIDKLTPPSLSPKVHGSPYRYHAAYLGACVLAGSPGFQEAKITREDWEQHGVGCLKKWHL